MLTTELKSEVVTVWRRDGNVYSATADGTPEQLLGAVGYVVSKRSCHCVDNRP